MLNLKRPTQAELDGMSHAEKDALILKLFDLLEGFERRFQELENKIEKTSRNSSQPPSSEGLKKGAAHPRRKGDKPIGGVPGHKGSTREMVEHPDYIIDLRPQGTCGCGRSLDGREATLKERRQQIEIPEPKTEITEYRQYRVACECGLAHCGEFPAGITPNVSFGPRLKGYAVGLVQGHFVALERTCEIIGDQYGIQPSDGAVQNWIIKASQQLAAAHAAHRQTILEAEVSHFDESGMRVGGTLNWLHVAVTERAVYYTVHPQRGQKAMEAAGILPQFQGQAVHDHWKPYLTYNQCTHSLCNAHHLRELQYCADLTGHFWPTALSRLLVEGHRAVEEARAAGQTTLEPAYVEDVLARYDRYIANGLAACPVRPKEPGHKGRIKQSEPTNLLLRLRDYKDHVWRFITDWRVPFDNNRAERAVRPVKVKLKVIGGFRAMGGSEAFCILRSVWETNKLNGINPFDALRLAFEGR